MIKWHGRESEGRGIGRRCMELILHWALMAGWSANYNDGFI